MFNKEKLKFIHEFGIINLFGYKNFNIRFDDQVKILVGENGYGKTTVLSCLYFLLVGDYESLIRYKFDIIHISIGINKIRNFIIKRDIIKSYCAYKKESNEESSRLNFYKEKIKTEYKGELYGFPKDANGMITNVEDHFFEKISKHLDIPYSVVLHSTIELIEEYNKYHIFEELKTAINSTGIKFLYYPTYRRIEENFKNIISNKYLEETYYRNFRRLEIIASGYMKFGMDDVQKRIHDILSLIRQKSVDGFSSISGNMLTILTKSKFQPTPELFFLEEVRIILGRAGDSISEETKKIIIDDVQRDPFLTNQNPYLKYFLYQLLTIYKSQRKYDDSIKRFVDVCNKYLEDKKFVYDESSLSLGIYRKCDDNCKEKLVLECLSSGEKQIISIFSQLYLEFDKKICMLIDEPELSLSINWQSQLLPDIMKSDKCCFLLAVTHSPFIFDNEFKYNTFSIANYIS